MSLLESNSEEGWTKALNKFALDMEPAGLALVINTWRQSCLLVLALNMEPVLSARLCLSR